MRYVAGPCAGGTPTGGAVALGKVANLPLCYRSRMFIRPKHRELIFVTTSLIFVGAVRTGHSQVTARPAEQIRCMEALQAYALGDLQGAISKIAGATTLDRDRNNPWLHFWEGVIREQIGSTSSTDVLAAMSKIESAISSDISGKLAIELVTLWGLESERRGRFAYLYRNYYCRPDSLQTGRTSTPPNSPVATTKVAENRSKARLKVQLGSEGYIYFACEWQIRHKDDDSPFRCRQRVWDGYVYDNNTHAVVAEGSTYKSADRTFCIGIGGGCSIEAHTILYLDNGRSYVIRLLDEIWHINPVP